jgi:outer membrane murein-binding lipoprotein Lpp
MMDTSPSKPTDTPPPTIEHLAANVDGLKQQIEQLAGDVERVNQEIMQHAGDVQGVKQQVQQHADKVEGLKQQIDQHAESVEGLTQKVDKETTGLARFIKWAGLIVALLVGVVTVPKAVKDSWESYFARPETTVAPESSLLLTYNPTTRIIGFGFAFTIANNGKRKDTIQGLSARLKRIDRDSSSDLLTLGDNDFEFSEKNVKIPHHFSVSESMPREVDGSVKAYLDEQLRSGFLLPKSRWLLDVVLTGEYGHSISMKYCFDVSQDDIEQILKGTELFSSSMKDPNCEGYAH